MSTAADYTASRLASARARAVASVCLVPPTVEPVSLELYQEHAKFSDAVKNLEAIPLRLAAARMTAETYVGRACCVQTWRDTFDALPASAAPLWLARGPLIPVAPAVSPIVSVTGYDAADVPTILDPASYRVDAAGWPPRLILDPGVAWHTAPRPFGSLEVIYTVGYGTTGAATPAPIRHAILLLATEFYAQAEAASDVARADVPFGVRALLDPYV